ncbi:hydrogenase expression/formation C-terminal domain-containing protein [Dendrosporobacter sp. 1207_IL3150]|uniref:hydrogenase expression/formation C-terminal domain-containing protein n=1 Tax=Dendrosporobacter sp. 1207_IL3150 TaxID=3084054 RepID=UPI002FD8ADF0
MKTSSFSANVLSILHEIYIALEKFKATGEIFTIFINQAPLTQDERKIINDFLGKGSISVKLGNSSEPAEWQETGITGVWSGVIYNSFGKPIVELIEIGAFPQLASAHPEDLKASLSKLGKQLQSLE